MVKKQWLQSQFKDYDERLLESMTWVTFVPARFPFLQPDGVESGTVERQASPCQTWVSVVYPTPSFADARFAPLLDFRLPGQAQLFE